MSGKVILSITEEQGVLLAKLATGEPIERWRYTRTYDSLIAKRLAR